MTTLLLFILATYGLTNALCFGNIFDRIRPPQKFFHCPMCMGFWVGVLVSILFWASGVVFLESLIINALTLGWLSSGTSYFLCMVFDEDGLKIQTKENENV